MAIAFLIISYKLQSKANYNVNFILIGLIDKSVYLNLLTLCKTGLTFNILLSVFKLASLASFKVKYSFNF